ncbi:murein hydrolase activator EnvC family protein [Jannaschia pohangensis]|uniref:Septal ring factor EnvC, activator of murein hydrolases AmiA and AmiB n=1 Tax=Jannaschia pohangensis TaxID=390807 RepID=A0A1I3T543_9RHOB|nr:peptidoglycan DD-metalloendopeptidase family protein [Jannaschia pohangensis]SFJ65740.1 Septal ring factor EnvC, activator of murein hydrolases AmiA and AmiB [Jannaschia pohangensis]
MIWRATLLLAVLAFPALAQTPVASARSAAVDLARAAQTLQQAQDPAARVRALTGVVEAYEAGQSALRAGLRQAAVRQATLTEDLAAREAQIAQLLGALQAMDRMPAPLMLIHPTGPRGTAQAAMMLQDVAPALSAQADDLRRDLAEIEALETLEQTAATSIDGGLSLVQDARVALSEAMAERTDLPVPVAADMSRIADLLARVDDLTAFADQLEALRLDQAADPQRPLPLPVPGTLLRGFGDRDAAGITRPGLILETPPGALVSAPAQGTVRYAGPLLDYENVIVLEPRADLLLVFAGLSTVYLEAGQIVDRGAEMGLMGDGSPVLADLPQDNETDGGASRAETLYIEVRQGGTPIDPATWFATE